MPRYLAHSEPPTVASPYSSGVQQAGLNDRIVGIVFSDQAGNLFVDQSADGGNHWYTDTVAITANTAAKISVELVAPYYRVRFVPASDTSDFQLNVRSTSSGYRG